MLECQIGIWDAPHGLARFVIPACAAGGCVRACVPFTHTGITQRVRARTRESTSACACLCVRRGCASAHWCARARVRCRTRGIVSSRPRNSRQKCQRSGEARYFLPRWNTTRRVATRHSDAGAASFKGRSGCVMQHGTTRCNALPEDVTSSCSFICCSISSTGSVCSRARRNRTTQKTQQAASPSNNATSSTIAHGGMSAHQFPLDRGNC